jgi:uncharacterized protein YndB with AHSA1/START domain
MLEQIDIAAPVEVVWPFVADPVRMAKWQPKIASVTSITAGEARLGARYRIVFRMNGREQPFTTTIEKFEPPVRVVFLHVGQKERTVRETFDLAPSADKGHTNVRHEIDLSDSGIPWYWKPVIAFITRFGQPQGDGPLEHLKRHVESPASSVSSSPQNR